jgi:hypothetical protein
LTFAIARERTAIADYLRSKGAVVPEEKAPAAKPKPKTLNEEIVAYFDEHFGPVQKETLIEFVPSEPPIAIHVIPPGKDRDHITLFTTGMSKRAMTVPDNGEEYQFAELFIQLPAKWPFSCDALGDPKNGWPVHWLRSTARYPHQNKTWLGGPVTIIANDDPPKPLAPNTKFTSLLLMAEKEFKSKDGRTIQLYRMAPLYTEERQMEIDHDLPTLLRALDKRKVSFVVDLKRPNVAMQSSD